MKTTKLTAADLPSAAFQARKASGLTQDEAAERLEVNQPNVSKAENDETGRYIKLQIRMIQELAGWQIEGPYWLLTQNE